MADFFKITKNVFHPFTTFNIQNIIILSPKPPNYTPYAVSRANYLILRVYVQGLSSQLSMNLLIAYFMKLIILLLILIPTTLPTFYVLENLSSIIDYKTFISIQLWSSWRLLIANTYIFSPKNRFT